MKERVNSGDSISANSSSKHKHVKSIDPCKLYRSIQSIVAFKDEDFSKAKTSPKLRLMHSIETV